MASERVLVQQAGLVILGQVDDVQVDGDLLPITRELELLNLNPHPVYLRSWQGQPRNAEPGRPFRAFHVGRVVTAGERCAVLNYGIYTALRTQPKTLGSDEPFGLALLEPRRLTTAPPVLTLQILLPSGQVDVHVPIQQMVVREKDYEGKELRFHV
ncbi:hypothetical protein [uncultured Deinococcus sp.]|uniref:hypothetical protein n=1 Tax=uncultured Deinococcus sp. TaxID=158789 RepID=UPI0025F771CD|nr:hypothetical protein [uncultured Deinococcus sp.]